MAEITFLKMHGLGNDFVVLNGITDELPGDLPSAAVALCDRRRGVGADGLIAVLPSAVADCRMRIFNADGSEAQMCGNGIRCVGKLAYETGIVSGLRLTIETLGGTKSLRLTVAPDGIVSRVTVDMGALTTRSRLIPAAIATEQMIEAPVATSFGEIRVTGVSVGNPHGVTFTDSAADAPVLTLGLELETHPVWPEKANIEFVEIIDRHTIAMRTWERGVGETQACGTGACAAAYAAVLTDRAEWPVTVRLAGGDLDIDRDPASGHILMSGTATHVFKGRYDIDAQ